jgi:hypothetical protein
MKKENKEDPLDSWKVWVLIAGAWISGIITGYLLHAEKFAK